MQLIITELPPEQCALHVEFNGPPDRSRAGALLTLTAPETILEAARRSGRHGANWVVWDLDSLPWNEHRAAAFAVRLARCIRGRAFVVLANKTGRSLRIRGHLLRAGCEEEGAPLSLRGRRTERQ